MPTQNPVHAKKLIPLLVLLAIFAALVMLYGRTLGPFEGPDEEEHFAYVTHLMREGRLPDWEADFESPIRQEVSQAPLYYVVAALWGKLGRLESWTGRPANNPWWPGVGVGAVPTTNHNHYLMKEGQHILDDNLLAMARAARWVRFTSTGFGMIALAAVYWGGLALWQDRRWALLAASLFAFTPELLQVFSTISNDTAVIAFSTVIVAGSLHLCRAQNTDYRLAAGVGLAMGLAALSKTSGLALWPVPLLALVLNHWQAERHNRNRRSLVSMAVLMLGIALVISGWWYARGWLLYSDPLGTDPHGQMPWGRQDNALTAGEFWDYAKNFWPHLWALFGWGFITPPLWGFVLPLVAVIVSGVGWFTPPQPVGEGLNTRFRAFPLIPLRSISRRTDWRNIEDEPGIDTKPFLLLVAVVLLGLAAVVYWLINISIVPPRLFFPFYSAVVLLVGHGLTRFPALRHWWAGTAGALALIIVPTTLYPAYGTPPLFDEPPDDLRGQSVVFDGATLLGYTADILDEARHIYEFSLCWMAPDEAHAMRHPFAISILNNKLEPVADLISYTGMGRYTYWQAGKGFCDKFSLELPPEPARDYSITVNLYDLESGAIIFGSLPDGTPREGGFIGNVAVPGPPVSVASLQNALYSLDDTLYLLDYSIAQNSDLLAFDFVWGTSRANAYPPVHQFIHVFDAGGRHITQVDFSPASSGYAIQSWGANERIVDHASLPTGDLPPGEYRLVTGLYFVDDVQRLPVVDANGDQMLDNIIPLGTVTIPAKTSD